MKRLKVKYMIYINIMLINIDEERQKYKDNNVVEL